MLAIVADAAYCLETFDAAIARSGRHGARAFPGFQEEGGSILGHQLTR